MKTLSQLFIERPRQWGLRGDPLLWEDMKSKADRLTMPKSCSELERMLQSLFLQLTGSPLHTRGPVFVARYAKGGMSGGMVSPEFWKETAVPLLVSRYQAAGGGEG